MTRARMKSSWRKWRERCSGRRRDGQRCRALSIPGGFVCLLHGGGAPQVTRAMRLAGVGHDSGRFGDWP
jgi:hypothetical protein